MFYHYIFPTILLSFSAAQFTVALPTYQEPPPPPPSTPNPFYQQQLTTIPAFLYCPGSSARYDPTKFICHDNEVICPILTGYNAGASADSPARPMERCENSCYDPRIAICSLSKVTPKAPNENQKRDVVVDTQHVINEGDEEMDLEDKIAARNLFKRYAEAWQLTREPAVEGNQWVFPEDPSHPNPPPRRGKKAKRPETGHRHINVSKSSEYGSGVGHAADDNYNTDNIDFVGGLKRVLDTTSANDKQNDVQREEDEYLHFDKRWKKSQLKSEPVVEVKHIYETDSRLRQLERQRMKKEGKGRTVDRMDLLDNTSDIEEPTERFVEKGTVDEGDEKPKVNMEDKQKEDVEEEVKEEVKEDEEDEDEDEEELSDAEEENVIEAEIAELEKLFFQWSTEEEEQADDDAKLDKRGVKEEKNEQFAELLAELDQIFAKVV